MKNINNARRMRASMDWFDRADGELFAKENVKAIGTVYFYIRPVFMNGSSLYQWEVYAKDADMVIGDDIETSLYDAIDMCEKVLRDIKGEIYGLA